VVTSVFRKFSYCPKGCGELNVVDYPSSDIMTNMTETKEVSNMKFSKRFLQKVEKKFPRAGFEGLLYFEICGQAYTLVKQMREIVDYRQSQDSKLRRLTPGERDLLDKLRKQEAIVITFAAMCLEACIWDYAACNTSQNKAEEYFGSLNIVAKWVVIPKLLCGSDITAKRIDGRNLLCMLRNLKEARNHLVHSKSTVWPDDKVKFYKLLRHERKITAEDAYGLIKLLLLELEKVDKTNWWFFEKAAYTQYIKKS
jgi:hypothetical protein